MSSLSNVASSLEEQWKGTGVEGRVAGLVVECTGAEDLKQLRDFQVRSSGQEDHWNTVSPYTLSQH